MCIRDRGCLAWSVYQFSKDASEFVLTTKSDSQTTNESKSKTKSRLRAGLLMDGSLKLKVESLANSLEVNPKVTIIIMPKLEKTRILAEFSSHEKRKRATGF